MKTIEEIQAIVGEISTVCERHGIVLIGNCHDEGIYGEICIVERDSNFLREFILNKIDYGEYGQDVDNNYYVSSIGPVMDEKRKQDVKELAAAMRETKEIMTRRMLNFLEEAS
jgi:hypothetical protein